jgi:hypothetical protein
MACRGTALLYFTDKIVIVAQKRNSHYCKEKIKKLFYSLWKFSMCPTCSRKGREARCFRRTFHPWLWYIQLAARPQWLLWMSVISLVNTKIFSAQVLSRPQLFPLLTQFVSTNSYTTFRSHSRLEDNFRTFFWVLDEQLSQISLNKNSSTWKASSGWVAILLLCCTLVARIEITFYASVQKKISLALCNTVRWIFVWLLLSYQ